MAVLDGQLPWGSRLYPTHPTLNPNGAVAEFGKSLRNSVRSTCQGGLRGVEPLPEMLVNQLPSPKIEMEVNKEDG